MLCQKQPLYESPDAKKISRKNVTQDEIISRATSTSMCRAMLNNIANLYDFAPFLLATRHIALNVAITYAIKKLARQIKKLFARKNNVDTLQQKNYYIFSLLRDVMARENLDEYDVLISELERRLASTKMGSLNSDALKLKIMEFRTTGLEQIVEVINKSEMTAEEKLALIEFAVSAKDLEQERFTKALLNHERALWSFKRYFELTEVAEKNDSFFLDHEEIKTHWIQWYSDSKERDLQC